MLCDGDVVFASRETNESSDYHSVRYVNNETKCRSKSTNNS